MYIAWNISRVVLEDKYVTSRKVLSIQGEDGTIAGKALVTTSKKQIVVYVNDRNSSAYFSQVVEHLTECFGLDNESIQRALAVVLQESSRTCVLPSPFKRNKQIHIERNIICVPMDYNKIDGIKRMKRLRQYVKFNKGLDLVTIPSPPIVASFAYTGKDIDDLLPRLRNSGSAQDWHINRSLVHLGTLITKIKDDFPNYRDNNNVRQTISVHAEKCLEMVSIYISLEGGTEEKDESGKEILRVLKKLIETLHDYIEGETLLKQSTISEIASGINSMLERGEKK